MTPYKCKGCGIQFKGFDPIKIDNCPELCLPKCPNAASEIDDIMKEVDHSTYEAFYRTQAELEKIMGNHTVVYAEHPSPQGAWVKSLSVKPETEEEKKLRETQSKLDAEKRKAEIQAQELMAVARKLVNRMITEMNQGGGSVSRNFPKDKEYGTKDSGKLVNAGLEVIQLAANQWIQLGADYSYRAPKFKQVWGLSMANFERLREPGNPNGGKHNYHVVLS